MHLYERGNFPVGNEYEFTCMQHLQLQKHEGSVHQKMHLCIAPSCQHHTDGVMFEMD